MKNRMFSSPTSLAELGPEEHYSKENIEYYKLRALGGAAVVPVGDVIVDLDTGRSHPQQVGINDPSAAPYLAAMADAIHAGGAMAEVEIDHGGALCSPEFIGGKNAFGPSHYIDPWGDEVDEMTEEQICWVADKFAEAAKTAEAYRAMDAAGGAMACVAVRFLCDATYRKSVKKAFREAKKKG